MSRAPRAPRVEPGSLGEPEPLSDPESVARVICLQALTRRARTRSELADLLRRRGVPDDAATAVLGRFTDIGLIDDVAFARDFTEAAHRDRGLSRRAVAMKLRQRGVDAPVVDDAVAQIDSASEKAAAVELAHRKLATLRAQTPDVQARRIVGLLARRGYSPALAYAVAREVIGSARLEQLSDDAF